MAVSREEYLKRYLSGPIQEKKKSKKKASKAVNRKAGLKILDDDIDFKSLLPNNIKNSLDDDLADDNPVVIDLGLDDRPEQIKELERMRNSRRWKVIAQDKDDSENLQQSEPEEEIRKDREAVKNSFEHSNSSSSRRQNERKRYDSESDASPARIADDEVGKRSISPTRKRRMPDSESAASSVRTAQRERHFQGNDSSTGKRKRQDSTSSSDDPKSPARQRQDSTDGSADNSPKRRRLDSDGSADNSPRRQQTQGTKSSFKNSSPKRKRKDSADNVEDSPPRRKQGRDSGSDNSPPRRKQGRDPSSDNSPPRRKQGRYLSSDNSPPRRRGKDSAGSVNNSHPQERRNKITTHSDSSPPRRRKAGRVDSDSDNSPPRKENKSFQQKQTKDRTDQRLDAANSPQVIYRKDGKRRDLQAEKKLKDEEEAEKAALAAKYKEWNKGLKQKEMVQERIADALNEVEKPLARYRDDKDLDSHLRSQLHDEDPMLAFMKKKKSTAKGGVEKPRYRGPQPPPNRFNIEPGYRWDGVDRSNGFEKKFFSKRSEDKAVKDMAYKWSVEDM